MEGVPQRPDIRHVRPDGGCEMKMDSRRVVSIYVLVGFLLATVGMLPCWSQEEGDRDPFWPQRGQTALRDLIRVSTVIMLGRVTSINVLGEGPLQSQLLQIRLEVLQLVDGGSTSSKGDSSELIAYGWDAVSAEGAYADVRGDPRLGWHTGDLMVVDPGAVYLWFLSEEGGQLRPVHDFAASGVEVTAGTQWLFGEDLTRREKVARVLFLPGAEFDLQEFDLGRSLVRLDHLVGKDSALRLAREFDQFTRGTYAESLCAWAARRRIVGAGFCFSGLSGEGTIERTFAVPSMFGRPMDSVFVEMIHLEESLAHAARQGDLSPVIHKLMDGASYDEVLQLLELHPNVQVSKAAQALSARE